MATRMVIPVLDLVERTTGRARARQAFDCLTTKLPPCNEGEVVVTIDLSSADMVTGSFLDELVLRIAELPAGIRIVFRFASESEVYKLKKVCTIRQTKCWHQIGESGPITLVRTRRMRDVNAEPYPAAFFTT